MGKLWRLPPVGFANDIETGAFEVADEILEATDRLFDRVPDARPWIVRIGHRAVHRFKSIEPSDPTTTNEIQ